MIEMKYSVLMSVYDRENSNFFDDSLSSIINQTKIPNQIVIVKDGFINNNLQLVINKYKNMRFIELTEVQIDNNVGLGKALDVGLSFCKYDIVARMDTDDISLPKRCEMQINEFIKD